MLRTEPIFVYVTRNFLHFAVSLITLPMMFYNAVGVSFMLSALGEMLGTSSPLLRLKTCLLTLWGIFMVLWFVCFTKSLIPLEFMVCDVAVI